MILSKNNKRIIFVVTYLLIIAPFVYNLFLYSHLSGGFLMESSIFSLDYGKYFHDLIYNKSHFIGGQYLISISNISFFYGLLYIVELFLSSIPAYFVLVSLFYFFGFYFFIKLFLELDKGETKDTPGKFFIICLLGLLYFSSLTVFNYIKLNFLFTLPILILPIALYCALKFYKTDQKWYLLFILLLGLVTTSATLTHFLISALFINIFLLILNLEYRVSIKELIRKLILINFSLLPAFLLFVTIMLASIMYFGDYASLVSVVNENFYSLTTNYVNIFSLATDWSLFGSWRGIPYNVFSAFYANRYAMPFGLLPYFLLLYLFFKVRAQENKKIIIAFSILFLLLFQIMLGMHNPIYKYLYDHVLIFQVFRNITKFAPFLYLALVLLIYLLICNYLKQKNKPFIIFLFLAGTLIYNIPFWYYSGSFFRDRVIENIPSYWHEASAYIENNLDDSSKILMLPATYILDAYNWNGKVIQVQGNLLDSLITKRSFRLSEVLVGDRFFQKDANALFVPSQQSVRGLDINYQSLTDFTKKYNLDYILLAKDSISEYQRIQDIEKWLTNSSYKKEAIFGPIEIYRNENNFKPLMGPDNILFSKVDHQKYHVYLKNLHTPQVLSFLETFNQGWNLYIRPNPSTAFCKISGDYDPKTKGSPQITECQNTPQVFSITDMTYLWKTALSDRTHQLFNYYANRWTIDPIYIQKNYPSQYYKKNSDGSIDIEFILYFRPQSYFYLGIIVSSLLMMVLVGYVACSVIISKRSQ